MPEFMNFGLTEEELFSRVDCDSLSSEQLPAEKYAYWHSVFRDGRRKRTLKSG